MRIYKGIYVYTVQQCVKVKVRRYQKIEVNLLIRTLKGQWHEVNNIFDGLKNQVITFCIGAVGFSIFFCIFCYEK